jgi:hypothetical protein
VATARKVERKEQAMREAVLSLILAGCVAGGLCSPAAAQGIGIAGPAPLAVSLWSPDPLVRERQEVARQLAVLGWTRWQANAWALYGPDEFWAFGQPLNFAWDFPPVQQPIGYQRIDDGRGGYSSFPVYAAPAYAAPAYVGPLPRPLPEPPVQPAQPEVGARDRARQRANAPAARTAEAPRRVYSW